MSSYLILPFQVVTAMKHIFVTEAKEAVTKHYHHLLAALLIKLGSYNGAVAPLGPDRPRSSSDGAKASSKQKSKSTITQLVPVQ